MLQKTKHVQVDLNSNYNCKVQMSYSIRTLYTYKMESNLINISLQIIIAKYDLPIREWVLLY